MALKVEGTLEELRELFMMEAKKELKQTAKRAGKKVVKKTVTRATSEWQRFLKNFKFRKQKRNEKSSTYFGLRTKAAARAYKRRNKK